LKIRPFTRSDYDAARALWERSEGVGLSGADEREAIFAFLERNPDMRFVATTTEGKLIGTILGLKALRGIGAEERKNLALFSMATNDGTALVQG